MPISESGMPRGNIGIETTSKLDISVYHERIARACEYLSVTQQRIRNGYRWSDSGKSVFCVKIAREVAEMLLPLGPSIIEVLGERLDGLHNEPLIPKCYNNGPEQRLAWTDHHLVCAKDDVIFDPIVGKPIDAHLYRTTVFQSPVRLSTHVPANEIATYLKDPVLWHSRRRKI